MIRHYQEPKQEFVTKLKIWKKKVIQNTTIKYKRLQGTPHPIPYLVILLRVHRL